MGCLAPSPESVCCTTVDKKTFTSSNLTQTYPLIYSAVTLLKVMKVLVQSVQESGFFQLQIELGGWVDGSQRLEAVVGQEG